MLAQQTIQNALTFLYIGVKRFEILMLLLVKTPTTASESIEYYKPKYSTLNVQYSKRCSDAVVGMLIQVLIPSNANTNN